MMSSPHSPLRPDIPYGHSTAAPHYVSSYPSRPLSRDAQLPHLRHAQGPKRLTASTLSATSVSLTFDDGWKHAQRMKQRQKLRRKKQITTIHTSMLYEPKTEQFLENVSIDVDTVTGRISRLVQHDADTEVVTRAGDVDLRGKFVMPGLVDAHTHVFLHSFRERTPAAQLASESVVERTIRATNHVRAALYAGYTSIRDLGTEGMQSFDTELRDTIKNGLTPGPRLFVATHPVASAAAVPSANRPAYTLDIGDGIAGIVAAVQRRAKAGADVIKVYCDMRRSSEKMMSASRSSIARYAAGNDTAPAVPAFNYAELRALVNEARNHQIPVAAHATSAEAALNAVEAGVSSLEHGPLEADEELFLTMKQRNCIYVPTLAWFEALNPEALPTMHRNVRLACDIGTRIAAGGDAGVFSHGQGARELELLIDAGVPIPKVLAAATINGWRACGGSLTGMDFGWFGEGAMADVLALDVDPRIDGKAFRRIDFIMKEGVIWKIGGARTPLMFGPGELGFPGAEEAEMGWEVVEVPGWRD